MTDNWRVEVQSRRVVGPGVIALTVTSPPGFEARPGQFVLVRTEDLGDRHYTISSPDVENRFEMTLDTAPDGQVATWLADRSPGDRLDIEGPFGRTYYDGGDVVAIGGGSGIGAAVGVAERALREGNDVTVVGADSLVHERRLSALAAAGASVFFVTTELTAAIEAARYRGRVFVFGFRGFIDRVRTAAAEAGADPDTFAYESYGTR